MGNNTTALRTQRIANLTTALLAKRATAKNTKYATTCANANKQAYMLAVQQLAAQYGVTVPAMHTARAAGTAKHAPSTVSGACAQVQAIAAQHTTRAATIAACIAAGINPATASTQYAKYRKAHLV